MTIPEPQDFHIADATRLIGHEADPMVVKIAMALRAYAGEMEQRRQKERLTPVDAYRLDYEAAAAIVREVNAKANGEQL